MINQPPYPTQYFPSIVIPAIAEVIENHQVTDIMAATSCLTAMSIAASPLVDWRHPLSGQIRSSVLNLAIEAISGDRKSTADECVCAPLYEHDARELLAADAEAKNARPNRKRIISRMFGDPFRGGGTDFIDLNVFSCFDLRLNLQQLGPFALAFDAGFQKQLRQFRVRYGPRLGGQRRHTIQHGVLLLMLLVRLPGGFAAGFQYGVGLYWIDLAIGEGEDTFADKFADILPGHASALGISVLRQQSGGTVV